MVACGVACVFIEFALLFFFFFKKGYYQYLNRSGFLKYNLIIISVTHLRQWIFKWMKNNDASSENKIMIFLKYRYFPIFECWWNYQVFARFLSTPLPLPWENKILQILGKWINVPKRYHAHVGQKSQNQNSSLKKNKIRTWIYEFAAICKASHKKVTEEFDVLVYKTKLLQYVSMFVSSLKYLFELGKRECYWLSRKN